MIPQEVATKFHEQYVALVCKPSSRVLVLADLVAGKPDPGASAKGLFDETRAVRRVVDHDHGLPAQLWAVETERPSLGWHIYGVYKTLMGAEKVKAHLEGLGFKYPVRIRQGMVTWQ